MSDCINTPIPQPTVFVESPSSRLYGDKDELDDFIPVLLPVATATSGIASPNISMTYMIAQGSGIFTQDGSVIPGTVLVSGDGTAELTLTGPDEDVSAASATIEYTPNSTTAGEVVWFAKVLNDENTCAGVKSSIIPNELLLPESTSSNAKFTINSVTTDGTIVVYTQAEDGSDRRQLTSGAIPFVTDVPTTAIAVANDITNNAVAKNAFDVSNPAWLPLYVATADGNDVIVSAPAAAGNAFNGYEFDFDFTGSFDEGGVLDFFGGTLKNVTDGVALNEFWNEYGEIITTVGGVAAGQAAVNVWLNNSSELEITFPIDDDDINVTFLYRGNKVNVPTEYDGLNRVGSPTYDEWGGTWKKEWTNNPAWCLLDYIENEWHGLGTEIVLDATQKEALYRDIFEIAQYSDEKILLKSGDSEPRFSLNTVITEGTKIEILEQICSVFYGAYTFYNGSLRIRADKPNEVPTMLACQASVDDIEYNHTSLNSFVNKVNVTYIEPANFYIKDVVTAENTLGIEKYGEKTADVVAFGTTSRDQARRYANWVLNTELSNSLTVSYTAGWDHYKVIPGDIIEFEDSNERGFRLAGRTRSVSGTTITLDGPVVANIGDVFSLVEADGSIFTSTVAVVDSPTQVTLDSPPLNSPNPGNVFVISGALKQLYSVVAIDEISDGVFSVTLQIYQNSKYDNLDPSLPDSSLATIVLADNTTTANEYTPVNLGTISDTEDTTNKKLYSVTLTLETGVFGDITFNVGEDNNATMNINTNGEYPIITISGLRADINEYLANAELNIIANTTFNINGSITDTTLGIPNVDTDTSTITAEGEIIGSITWSQAPYELNGKYEENSSGPRRINKIFYNEDTNKWFSFQSAEFNSYSLDDGVTWTQGPDTTNEFETAIGYVYAGNYNGNTIVISGTAGTYKRSVNNGVSWNNISAVEPDTTYGLASGPDGTWVSTHRHSVYCVSTDDGATWNVGSSNTASLGDANAVATDGNGTWIMVGNSSNIFVSTDNAVTFNQVSIGTYLGDLEAIATDYKGNWMILNKAGYVHTSNDEGATWTDKAISVSAVTWKSLATDTNGSWVIGSDDGKAAVTTNLGEEWTEEPINLNNGGTFLDSIYTIAASQAGTWMSGDDNAFASRGIQS